RPGGAFGQAGAVRDSAACDRSGASLYRSCVLWLGGRGLIQGDSTLVATSGFLRPIRLTRIVQGDSAKQYAAVYEIKRRRADWLSIGWFVFAEWPIAV